MAHPSALNDPIALSALALDGSSNTLNALSELYILQDAAGRWASDSGIDLRGEDVCPSDMFDIIGGTGIGGFYAVLFARLELTIGQVIQAHRMLEERLFCAEIWSQGQQNDNMKALNDTLGDIFVELNIDISLDSPFEDDIHSTKCIVCVLNVVSAETCRLLRNYRPRGSHSPLCTIRQVLHATLTDCDNLPPVRIQDEDFISALNGYANPARVLIKELGNSFPRRSMVACVASIGAGHSGPQHLTNALDPKALSSLLQSSELIANEFASLCHELGAFFFRLSVTSQLPRTCALDEAHSRVKGAVMGYLDAHGTTKTLDELAEALTERPEVVSLVRLGSLAGKDGQSELVARVQQVQQRLDETIFRDINNWLTPIQQTSKLDSDIQSRGETTCEWILQDTTFMQWMEGLGGLFWYHGLMGTGKTFTISFLIQSLLRRNDIYVAYYYFEFTNPITLSEEALHRSLVSQLASADPATMRDFHQKHNYGGYQPQLATLQATLKALVSASPKPVFIMIDALDELPPAQRKYLFGSLSAFCNSGSSIGTHIMVTSREDRDIWDALGGTADFQLGVQGDLVRQDIAVYVDQQLAAKKWTLWPRDEVELMRRILNERAGGQFRMVACQVNILLQAGTSDMLLKSLHSLPTTLGNTYEHILDQIRKELRGCARVLFTFLSFSSELMTVTELNALVAVDFGDESNPDQVPLFQKANHFHDPLDLLDLGTSLVSKTTYLGWRGYLQLSHASVKEYLLVESDRWFTLQEGPAHNLIAGACLAVLLHFEALEHSVIPFPYSLMSWFEHIFPNGPPSLLSQQKALYTTYPWPSAGFYLKAYDLGSPLSSAASFCLLDFLKTCLTTNIWDEDTLESALIAAAGSERPETLTLQAFHLLFNHTEKSGFHTPLGEALRAASDAGNLGVVQFIVEKNTDINAVGGQHWTALQAAACRGCLEVVQFLVENGANIGVVGGEYGTALQAAAAQAGNLNVVQLLLEKGADVNEVGGKYGTALHAAAKAGDPEVVEFLIKNGADIRAVVGKYGTLLQAAAAARTENLKVVQLFVEKGSDVNEAGGRYGTPLQAAAKGVHLGAVEFFVNMGADVHAVGGKYGTPLQAAAQIGQLETVRFFLEMGVDVNKVGGKYGTALQGAARCGHLVVVRFLIEMGADVHAVGGKYGTPLQAAARAGELWVVKFLVEMGADVHTVGGKYGTVLQAAVKGGHSGVVEFLVEMGVDVQAAGGMNGTVLQAAEKGGDLEMVHVEQGVDMPTLGGKHGSALRAATHPGSLGVIQLFSESDALANVIDVDENVAP
ncbi:hypothetical protein DL96DRAFT_1810644 [Flagelloscypha sp. PMI_526]|nr:hypothetical protein DL96DRAFT_1810644 [Flagelloscypha sp. PMI_526]